jgi:hypothetical protein
MKKAVREREQWKPNLIYTRDEHQTRGHNANRQTTKTRYQEQKIEREDRVREHGEHGEHGEREVKDEEWRRKERDPMKDPFQ